MLPEKLVEWANPGNSEVVMFECTARMSQQVGNTIAIGACGTSSSWGGCNIWVSYDEENYKQVGTINSPARLGVLSSTFNSGSDPDTTNSIVVDLVENSQALDAGNDTDADNLVTTCIIADSTNGNEVVSYSSCTVTGEDQYTMGTYLRRGQLGTSIESHPSGSLFMRLDDSVFYYQYDPTWAGSALYFKFQSFNTYGNANQLLSSLTATEFIVPGANPGTVEASSGLILNTPSNIVGAGTLAWNPVATSYLSSGSLAYIDGYGGYTGNALPSGVNNNYFYCRASGYITPSVTGKYTVGVNYSCGAQMFIGGANFGGYNLSTTGAISSNLTFRSSSTINMTAGVAYPVVVEWQQSIGSLGVQLLWTPPKGSVELIPTGNLSTSGITGLVGSTNGSLAVLFWNGSSGLYYPTGTGLIDPTNAALYGPPTNGGGTNVVNEITSVSTGINSVNYSPNSSSFPGWLVGQAQCTSGVIDVFIPAIGSGTTGYVFQLDWRNGSAHRIYKTSDVLTWTTGSTSIAQAATNPAAITTWLNFAFYVNPVAGYLGMWVNNALACQAVDYTYAIAQGTAITPIYGNGAATGKLAPSPQGVGAGSSALNTQGSIAASLPYTFTYTYTSSSIEWAWTSILVGFPDGNQYTVSSGSQNFTGLTASTTYYFTMYVAQNATATGGTVTIINSGTSAGSASSLLVTANDGNIPIANNVTAATSSSGSGSGGSGGGGIYCFTGNVGVKVPNDFTAFEQFPRNDIFQIVNETGTHNARLIIHENCHEIMIDMNEGKLVTMGHVIKSAEGKDVAAIDVFPNNPRVEFTGTLYNLSVLDGDDHHYILDNGVIAHNMKIGP